MVMESPAGSYARSRQPLALPTVRFSTVTTVSFTTVANKSCYKFTILDPDGRGVPAFLTYELHPESASSRGLLLTDDEHLLRTRSDRNAFRALRDALEHEPGAKFAATKALVNSLVDGELNLAGVKVAAHKFGPVPVFVLDGDIPVRVHGREYAASIAIFPAAERRRWDDQLPLSYRSEWQEKATRPPFVNGKANVRRCLAIGTGTMFRRYFEDAAEDLHDLRRILPMVEVYRRGKRVETTLAQSVKSKLRLLTPPLQVSSSRTPEVDEAWRIFYQYAPVLYEATVARNLILYLLNELYACIGIASRAPRYLERLAEGHTEFEARLGIDRAAYIRQSSRILHFLESCQRLVDPTSTRDRAFTSAGDLLDLAQGAPEDWVAETAKFAAFTQMVKAHTLGHSSPRVFLSSHHAVPSSEVVKAQLEHFMTEHGQHAVRPISVTGLPARTPVRHAIRSAIWISSGTIALCPRDTASLKTREDDKDYRWIAKEIEHSLLLKKRVLLGVEERSDETAIRRDLADSTIGYLARGTKVPADLERARRTESVLLDRRYVQFAITDTRPAAGSLDSRLRADADLFFQDATLSAVSDWLDGYLKQLEPRARKTLLATLECLGPLGACRRKTLVTRLAKFLRTSETTADRLFSNMWRQVRDRQIVLPSRSASLIELRNELYCERLTSVASTLRGILGHSGYKDWRSAWLRARGGEEGLRLEGRWSSSSWKYRAEDGA